MNTKRLFSLLVLFFFLAQAGAKEKPNVLFISVDDLNDWIGCLGGHPQALTPNMDRLAKRGVLFSNAHCAAPACNPSRSAVFSGLYPTKTGVWNNKSGSVQKLYPEAEFLPHTFSKSGYTTMGAGKLLHSKGNQLFDDYLSVKQRWSPLQKTDVLYQAGDLPSKGTSNPRHVTRDGQGREVVLPLNRMPSDRRPTTKDSESFDWGAFDVPDSDFGDTKITDWAIKKLKDKQTKPFFMGVGYYRPHIPLWAPKRFFERFKDEPAALPIVRTDDLVDVSETAKKWAREAITAGSHETVLKYDQWREAVEAYLACVTYVDSEIGRLLDALDKSEHSDNTLIVLWSDHGWHLGEKEHWGKWTGWERSTRVPLIFVPQKDDTTVSRSSVCKAPVGLIDLYPTLVESCGIEGPEMLHGQSLVPLLKNPELSTNRGLVTMFDKGNYSLRMERWRFIRYEDGSEELYDLEEDPNEWSNLIDSKNHQGVVVEMKNALSTELERLEF